MGGRDKRLIESRNRKIAERYYYWTEIQRLRFDDAIRQLSENEFFLSEQRIMAILRYVAETGALEEVDYKPKPHVRKPRISDDQFKLFKGEE